MNETLSPIIDAHQLLDLYNKEPFILIDASNAPNTKQNYDLKHLDGAIFVDSNTQLATIEEDVATGGRHPLPSIEQFAITLGELGITPKTHVIIYDDKNGANAAARFWWMLRSIGHTKVQVLNGGIQAAEKVGFPTNANPVAITKQEKYPCTSWQWPLSSIEEVTKVAQLPSYTIIDVREAFRYNGVSEPIDLVAGHIPGAINMPFTQNLNSSGTFLSSQELKEKYNAVQAKSAPEHTIVHCGSGITACHTLLAFAVAELPIPKLYVGSWSEWSRSNKPIATEK